MSQEKEIIRLDGCNIHKINYNEEGEVTGFCLKFGMLFLPCVEPERLIITDSGISLFEGLETHKNYQLDVTGWELDEEYKAFSKLLGADWQRVAWIGAIRSDNEELQEEYTKAKENSRMFVL